MTQVLRRLVAGGALAVAVAAVAGCGSDARPVHAEVANADGLRKGSLVRVSGARVGTVAGLRITPRDTVDVELDLGPDVALGTDAKVAIRPANLLGEKFVDLEIGDRSRPLGASGIPLARTSTPVELDDVLDVLDASTRSRVAVLLGEVGVTVNGRGEDIRAALKVLPPTVDEAARLVDQIGADTDVLQRLLVKSARVTGPIAKQRVALGRLIQTGEAALRTTAERRAGMQRLLDATPPALTQLRRTLVQLDRTGAALRPAAAGLRRTAAPFTGVLQALPAFATDAVPALRAVRQTGPALTRLGTRAAPVLRRLRPTAAALDAAAKDADPLTVALDGAIADLLGLTEAWARAIQTRDTTGHLFRVSLSFTPDVVRSLGTIASATRKRNAAPASPSRTTPAARKPAPPAAPPAKRPAPAGGAPTLPNLPPAVAPVRGGLQQLLDLVKRP